MVDDELLKSAGLYGHDVANGAEELNLAVIMLLGKDDVIKIIVPLDDSYSFDFGITGSATNVTQIATNATNQETNLQLKENEQQILLLMKENPTITQKALSEEVDISIGTIKKFCLSYRR